MTLKEEFDRKFEGKSYDTDDLWAWVLEKVNEDYDAGINDAIDWFGEELDRLVRTQQIDMIHTNIDKIISDAKEWK